VTEFAAEGRAAIIFGARGLAIAVAGGVNLYFRSAHAPDAIRLEAATAAHSSASLASLRQGVAEKSSIVIDSASAAPASDPRPHDSMPFGSRPQATASCGI
jgi:hypothetical protein